MWQEPVLLLINGSSRRGRDAFEEVQAALAAAGIAVKEAVLSRSEEHTEEVLLGEIAAGAAAVVVGGGDGTVHACAQILAGTPVAMAVIPLGTGNTFIRSLAIPLVVTEAAEALFQGEVTSVDLARCNDEYVLNSVSLGLSVAIANALRPEAKKILGLFAYPVAVARAVICYRPIRVEVRSNERSFVVRTHQLVVANGRHLAGPILASPEASLQSSLLEVFILGGAHKLALLRATVAWLTGRS